MSRKPSSGRRTISAGDPSASPSGPRRHRGRACACRAPAGGRSGMAIAISAVATTKTRNTSTAPTAVAGLLREGHEAQVDAVEHQLHAHQHHQHVAPDDDAEQARSRTARRATPISSWVLSMRALRPTLITASAATTAATSRTDDELEWSQYSFRNATENACDAEDVSPSSRTGRRQRPPDATPRSPRASNDEPGDPGHEQPRVAPASTSIAHVEQHDHVDHEHHHRADVDQHLERGDEVHAEQP